MFAALNADVGIRCHLKPLQVLRRTTAVREDREELYTDRERACRGFDNSLKASQTVSLPVTVRPFTASVPTPIGRLEMPTAPVAPAATDRIRRVVDEPGHERVRSSDRVGRYRDRGEDRPVTPEEHRPAVGHRHERRGVVPHGGELAAVRLHLVECDQHPDVVDRRPGPMAVVDLEQAATADLDDVIAARPRARDVLRRHRVTIGQRDGPHPTRIRRHHHRGAVDVDLAAVGRVRLRPVVRARQFGLCLPTRSRVASHSLAKSQAPVAMLQPVAPP